MLLRRLFPRWHQRREQVRRDASELLTWLGEGGSYQEARSRARACRAKQDRSGDRHWSRVAVEIADRTGYVVGQKVADRYYALRHGD